MSLTAKSVKSYKKQDLINNKAPTYAIQNLRFAHQASAGDSAINILALTVPTSMSSLGFTNPSQTEIIGANLFINRNNLRLVSSARGELTESYDYTVLANGSINFTSNFGTALAGEIFVGTLNNVAVTGTLIADTTFILETGTLAANTVSIPIGQSFKTNQNPSKQVGAVVVFIDGQQMFRNVGNATANPSADGDYQEVDNGAGDCTLITLNSADTVNARTYMVMSSWLSVVKPDGSVVETINKQQATIDKVVETLAVVAGVPETDFQAAPTQPQLNQFGDRLVTVENYTKEKYGVLAKRTTNFSIPTGASTLIIYDSESFDESSNYNTGTGLFTCPKDGLYQISAGFEFTAAVTATIGLQGWKNSSSQFQFRNWTTTERSFQVSGLIQAQAGDTISIRVSNFSGTSFTLLGGQNSTYMSIVRIPYYV